MNDTSKIVDQSALRFNQVSIIILRLADYYHVMTVPTTVVLDSQRRPVAINHGVATTEQLLAQVGQANVTRNP
jgi:hypothetical protein